MNKGRNKRNSHWTFSMDDFYSDFIHGCFEMRSLCLASYFNTVPRHGFWSWLFWKVVLFWIVSIGGHWIFEHGPWVETKKTWWSASPWWTSVARRAPRHNLATEAAHTVFEQSGRLRPSQAEAEQRRPSQSTSQCSAYTIKMRLHNSLLNSCF